jgi:hypothetical protein
LVLQRVFQTTDEIDWQRGPSAPSDAGAIRVLLVTWNPYSAAANTVGTEPNSILVIWGYQNHILRHSCQRNSPSKRGFGSRASLDCGLADDSIAKNVNILRLCICRAWQ